MWYVAGRDPGHSSYRRRITLTASPPAGRSLRGVRLLLVVQLGLPPLPRHICLECCPRLTGAFPRNCCVLAKSRQPTRTGRLCTCPGDLTSAAKLLIPSGARVIRPPRQVLPSESSHGGLSARPAPTPRPRHRSAIRKPGHMVWRTPRGTWIAGPPGRSSSPRPGSRWPPARGRSSRQSRARPGRSG